ncbi:hypothetical protein FO510_05895 [Bacillus pumilus]|uniref:hypothetical protein n=1 Tax=Bacillus TaxID=1386 RepID=UPI00017A5E18|nr:hypothetical protein [Bacillus pumilus]EDW22346.1 hypothetical protein BAT_0055 [Bacillus pumilus ATCC 7061]MBB6600730.1 hypothetical protein [Bacillus pumilus]MBU8697540.1 hypothetical protein [Bacillus pumilus]MCR4352097.1 hypothetical protein [Bacillus pumilus]MCY7506367.1 hypothetical protein [Bacillus pumilus]
MNEINETNEFTSFEQSKYIEIYLKQFGKKMHKATINQQTAFKEKIKKQHNRKEIQMLLGRTEDIIENKKSNKHYITALFAIMSFLFGSMLNHGITMVKKLGVHAPTFTILYVAFLTLGIWRMQSFVDRKEYKLLIRYKRLLQECLDEIPNRSFK